jgi:hypothetical protein
MKRCCIVVTALNLWFASLSAHANPTREFIMSCTYGVMAGTLVGAASLAFEDRPSDHLSKVARGASLGLYTGILLGVYVVYIVPGMENTEEEDPVALKEPPVLFMPTFDNRDRIDGMQASWNVFNF